MNQFRQCAEAIVRRYFPELQPKVAFSRAKGFFAWLEKPLEHMAAYFVNEPLAFYHANRIILPLPKTIDANSRYTECDVAMLCHAHSKSAFGIAQAMQQPIVQNPALALFEQAFHRQLLRARSGSDDNIHFAYDAFQAFQEYAGMNALSYNPRFPAWRQKFKPGLLEEIAFNRGGLPDRLMRKLRTGLRTGVLASMKVPETTDAAKAAELAVKWYEAVREKTLLSEYTPIYASPMRTLPLLPYADLSRHILSRPRIRSRIPEDASIASLLVEHPDIAAVDRASYALDQLLPTEAAGVASRDGYEVHLEGFVEMAISRKLGINEGKPFISQAANRRQQDTVYILFDTTQQCNETDTGEDIKATAVTLCQALAERSSRCGVYALNERLHEFISPADDICQSTLETIAETRMAGTIDEEACAAMFCTALETAPTRRRICVLLANAPAPRLAARIESTGTPVVQLTAEAGLDYARAGDGLLKAFERRGLA